MEDCQIVELFLQRDEKAISETERKYGAYIDAISFGILRDPSDTEEIKNDTLFELWKSIPPQIPRNFKAFLTTVTRRVSLNRYKQIKRSGRQNEIDLTDEELEKCLPGKGEIDERLNAEALSLLLDSFLREQSDEERRAFMLRYFYYKNIE